MDPEITITLAFSATGQSESIPVPPTTTVKEVMDLAKALLANVPQDFRLSKDNRILNPSQTLQSAGVVHGDLLAVQAVMIPTSASLPAPAPAPSGGLDFSSLLGQAPAPAPVAPSNSPQPVFYPGMTLQEAIMYNQHPIAFATVITQNDVLFKQLNHHQPILAAKLRGKSISEAAQIWREELVKGGIRGAMANTERSQREREMHLKLQKNPEDSEAKAYFKTEQSKQEIENQYREMMQEYPESMGRVLMLYIEAKVNDTCIQAFVDSGAQSTIMSKRCAEKCGIDHLIDTRFEGMAVGVGTGKILGRIHIVSLKIGGAHFPCTVTVMEAMGQQEMEFLLGLDMLKRHTCQIDLEQGVLRFRLAPGKYMAAPFLHEKDLDESRGGTKGFDADKANRDLEELRKKKEDDRDMET